MLLEKDAELMELTFFKDLIDSLERLISGVKKIADLPRDVRRNFRDTMAETYRLLDTSLNMVIIRLGDLQKMEHEQEFLNEVIELGNYSEWLKVERDFRLCASLRAMLRECQTLKEKFVGSKCVQDWDAALSIMESILMNEGELALFIRDHFSKLVEVAGSGNLSPIEIKTEIKKFRGELSDQREALIKQEVKLYEFI